MAERALGQEGLKGPTRASERIAQTLKWAAPNALVPRFIGIRSRQAEPILRYSHEGGFDTVISADYTRRRGPLSPAFGLRVNGDERTYITPADIEALLRQEDPNGWTGNTQSQQVEALMLHSIISNGEAHRELPKRNARHIEEVILGAHNAQTTAELNGSERIYFPFIPTSPDSSNPQGAKMIQLVTGRTGEEWRKGDLSDREIQDLRKIVDNRSVRQVLDAIPDHAVTIERVTFEHIKGAEFIKITDAKGKEHIVHELLSEELTGEILGGKKLMVVFGASGANAEHFSKGWKAQEQNLLIAAVGRNKKKLDHVGEIPISSELQLQYDPEKPQAYDANRMDALLGSGLVSYVYDSTPVDNRLPTLRRIKPYLQSGKVERYITTKPVARSLQDLLEMKKLLRQQDVNGKRLEERFFVHEHYVAKGPLRAFLSHAEEVIAALGTPIQLEISIQEERTAEHDSGDENRVGSLPDGLMQDLAPHAASISTLMQQLISGMGYDVPLRGNPIEGIPMLTKLRYAPTEFGTYPYEGKDVPIDTGFVVEGQTTIAKKGDPNQLELPEQHDLKFIWKGGKGLTNDKRVTLTFKDGSTVVIDLNGNITKPVDAPESIQYLFKDIEGKPQDNGYGGITAGALLGGHPEGTFQNFHDASVVWIMEHRLKELSNGTDPYEYQLGDTPAERPSIDELARRARRGQIEPVRRVA